MCRAAHKNRGSSMQYALLMNGTRHTRVASASHPSSVQLLPPGSLVPLAGLTVMEHSRIERGLRITLGTEDSILRCPPARSIHRGACRLQLACPSATREDNIDSSQTLARACGAGISRATVHNELSWFNMRLSLSIP